MTTPQRQKVDTIKALGKIQQPARQEWAVLTYLLNQDIIDSTGKVDDLYGVVYNLGNYPSFETARERMEQVIAMTGCNDIIIAKLGLPAELHINPKNATSIPVDLQGRLVKMQDQAHQKEAEQEAEVRRVQEEILAEKDAELDPTSAAYFQQQCYLAIRNRASQEFYLGKAKEAVKSYRDRVDKARQFYQRPEGPETERNWLIELEQKLIRRKEHHLFPSIKKAYEEIRAEIFPDIKMTEECKLEHLEQNIKTKQDEIDQEKTDIDHKQEHLNQAKQELEEAKVDIAQAQAHLEAVDVPHPEAPAPEAQ